MSHWLDEAEKKISRRKDKKTEIKDRIDHKKDEVRFNRELIEDQYLDAIDNFVSIIQRINNLPRENRIPFGQIYAKPKENKLDNLLHKFYSSRRVVTREFHGILRPFKEQHYKNTRSFFISIGREENTILLEYKDIKVKRERISDELSDNWIKKILWKLIPRKKEVNHDVKENISVLKVDELTKDLILEHIDWLAFKPNSDTLIK